MKARFGFTLVAALALLVWAGPAMAFHSGGVAECVGCHSMHEAQAEPLLVSGDESSTCLTCHQSSTRRGYYVATTVSALTPSNPPQQATPGGDFAWLRLQYAYTPRPGTTSTSTNYGETHGHNIVATTYGYIADTTNTVAPGGDMAAGDLKCISCHDPHSRGRRVWDGTDEKILSPYVGGLGSTYAPISGSGSYHNSWDIKAANNTSYAVGVYRLLGVAGYRAYGTTASPTNFPGAPMAVVNSSYNRLEYASGAESHTRVAYGHAKANGFTSWSEWCGTCHTDYHNLNGPEELKHPTETLLGSDIESNYNAYKKTGDLTGTQANAFTSLVPFAENTAEFTTLKAKATNGLSAGPGGASGSGRMACLTCHRAHAGAWEYGLRWNNEWEFLTLVNSTGGVVYPAADSTETRIDTGANIADYGAGHLGYSNAEMQAAYYGRPATVFAGFQRQLCNKCHIKD